MNPIEYIRKRVLKLTQAGLADVAGVTQGTVSRWESGELEPTRDQMSLIRKSAQDRRIKWDDSWFFKAPVRGREAA